MIRTYPLKHAVNIGKQEKILLVVKEYRKLAVRLARLQWREFHGHGDFDRNADIKEVGTELSERYKQTCQYQVVSVLKSFVANRQKEFVGMVQRSKLGAKERLHLFYINKYRLWFASRVSMPVFDGKGRKVEGQAVEIDGLTIRLARAIFKHILKRHRKPSLKRCNLALDSKVARISAKKRTRKKRARKFDYWITLSTLEAGKTIELPLLSNEYFGSKGGELKNFCQINVGREDGRIGICLIKDLEVPPCVPRLPEIALDFGLRTLFASDRGDLHGRSFMETLKKYDRYITSLARNRQRQGKNVRSHAYGVLVGNLRNYLKNEINRVINRIVESCQPQRIVVEELNFTSPQLSRRLNRIVSNAGRKIVGLKFASLQEQGITVSYVPAPYSSQRCSNCGYVDRNNRRSQSAFECRHCHKKLHADVNGARNLLARSSDKELSNVHLGKATILDMLVERFLQYYPDIDGCRHELLKSNPYFREHREFGTTGNLKFG